MADRTFTHRSRLLTLLAADTSDHVPWFADLDYYATALIARGDRPTDFKPSTDYIDWHEALGAGFYLQGYFPYRIEYPGCRVKESKEGNRRVRTVETPRGSLRECWQYLPSSFTEAPVEHFVKGKEDLPAYRYMYEHMKFTPDYSKAEKRSREIADRGINLCYSPKSPFMRLAVLDAGIETLTLLAFTEPEELVATVELMVDRLSEAVNIAAAAPVDAVMIPENLSSELIGKRFFHDYLEPVQTDWIGRIHEAGKFSFIHVDGSLRGLLAEEAALGFSVLEALTPAPVGDLAVPEWNEFVAPSKSVLWGGIPGSYFTPLVSEEEFVRHVRSVLAIMRTEPRYVLGVADQVPPDGMESRIKRVAELVDEFGKYDGGRA